MKLAALTLTLVTTATPAAFADEPAGVQKEKDAERLDTVIDELSDQKFLHGFRLGYLYIANTDHVFDGEQRTTETVAEHYGIKSNHQFLIGYELTWRMVGHDWLNILLVTNVLVSGLEQSKFFPSGNALVGFEILESAQLGVGVSATPTKNKPMHMLLAAGVTPRVGDFYVPLHAFFVPDVDGVHKFGTTIGVNW